MSVAEKSILIVDDNAPVRAAIRGFLERSGKCIVCGEAADGIEAVQIAREKHPRLVVMDLAMPAMNGLEAACEIKRIEPEALIVVFSLYSDAFQEIYERGDRNRSRSFQGRWRCWTTESLTSISGALINC